MNLVSLVFRALPIVISNTTPVWLARLLPKAAWQIDFGITLSDGRRLFGKNKTWRGLSGAILFSTLFGVLFPFFGIRASNAFLLGLGTMVGDLVTSFIKRRLGLASGARFWPWESFFFVLFPIMFAPGVFSFFESVLIVFVTPAIYSLSNFLAFKLGLKSVPW